LLERLASPSHGSRLVRARHLVNGEVVWAPGDGEVPIGDRPAPTYDGLDLDACVSRMELGVVSRLWLSERWIKLMTAHGCYWQRCTFCDTSLDYIGRFEPEGVETLLAKMRDLHRATGQPGFHFVDEAVPPALLHRLAERIARENLPFRWWANVRFDRYFTPDIAASLAAGGCIAATGGVEVASPRLLRLIDKGVDLPQVARVTRALTGAGILVHAYLIYGFPTETVQETVDSLEIVRQLFESNCLQSAYWHRFTLTVHSPIGRRPEAFGITAQMPAEPSEGWFAVYEVPFHDPTPADHAMLGRGLRRAVDAYKLRDRLHDDVRLWFDDAVPAPSVPEDIVASWLDVMAPTATGER
jgi:radical SAM superfamily enzyme YgiQ (UPF0313 family)